MAPSKEKQESATIRQTRKRKATTAATTSSTKPAKGSKRTVQPSATEEAKTGFLSLPAELRNEIYRLSLVEDSIVHVRTNHLLGKRWAGFVQPEGDRPAPWQEPAILSVCKAVRAEAAKMYYGSNDFEATLTFKEIEPLTQWLRAIVAQCGTNPFGHFNLLFVRERWAELSFVWPLVCLFHENDLHLETRQVDRFWPYIRDNHDRRRGNRARSLSFLTHSSSVEFENAIEETIELGRRGRVEGWREEWLEMEFDWLVDEKLTTGHGAKMMMQMKKVRRVRKKEEEAKANAKAAAETDH